MKSKNRWVTLLSIAIYICSFLFSCVGSSNKDQHIFPEDILREGDLVFRRGRSLVSRFVTATDKNGNYSHIGIVVKDEGRLKIVHAVPGEPDFEGDKDRVKMDEIKTFFKTDFAKSGALKRIDNDSIAHKAAAEAYRIFKRGTLFDHKYNLEDTTQMYCTEMIHFVFNKYGIDLTEGRRSEINVPALGGVYIFPSDIEKSSRLTLIYSF